MAPSPEICGTDSDAVAGRGSGNGAGEFGSADASAGGGNHRITALGPEVLTGKVKE